MKVLDNMLQVLVRTKLCITMEKSGQPLLKREKETWVKFFMFLHYWIESLEIKLSFKLLKF